MKGKIPEIASSHVSSCVLQTCVKYCSQVERDSVFHELKPHFLTFACNTYAVDAVLEDAEEKQTTSRFVKEWMSDLWDLAYYVEDVLDELNTEAQRRKLMAEHESSSKKVSKLIPSCFAGLTLRPSKVKFNKEMLSKIGGVTARLEEIP